MDTKQTNELQALLNDGKLTQALDWIHQTLKIHGENAVLLNQKALLEKKLHRLDAAHNTLTRAIALAPEYAASYNHLGLLYYQRTNFRAAQHQFENALKRQGDYVDALYNLALSLKAQYDVSACCASLLSIIDINPQYLPAHYLLAKTFLEKNKPAEAARQLAQLATLVAEDLDVLLEIIQLLLQFDRYLEAEPFCLLALKQSPAHQGLLYNLAVIAERQGALDQAIHYYHRVIDIHPDCFDALNNLGVLYLTHNQVETAKFYLQKALALNPDHKPLQHTVAAVSGDQKTTGASADYITALFDQYADHFDNHLLNALHYQVPEQLLAIIQQQLQPTPKSLTILDLGCGTGLCGQQFKPFAKQLTGVDLSGKMLEEARKKNCYDALHQAENAHFLQTCHNSFDLITAADVFVYQGDLTSIFSAASKALSTDGAFVFSTEHTTGEAYQLAKSGRFHHSPNYILQLAHAHQFDVIETQAVATRMQRDEPAKGMLYCLRKR